MLDSDDPVTSDLLGGLLELLADGGGWLYPGARLVARDGHLSVHSSAEPGELLGREDGSGLGFVHEPFVEALAHGVGEGSEDGLLLQREADEGDEVGEASGLDGRTFAVEVNEEPFEGLHLIGEAVEPLRIDAASRSFCAGLAEDVEELRQVFLLEVS